MMPCGLKNARVAYQRAYEYNFSWFSWSNEFKEYLIDLQKAFEMMIKFDFKMNLLKYVFGVSVGKFLGFLIHNKGIEVEKNKAWEIWNAKPPWNIQEFMNFYGSLSYLRIFISNLTAKTKMFIPLLKL